MPSLSPKAFVPSTRCAESYWSNFYSQHTYRDSSTFCKYVAQAGYAHSVIIDIGSGDGRDSLTFARTNRRVFGFDFSTVGVNRCIQRATDLGLLDRAFFAICDVSDAIVFGRALRRALGPPDTKREPATFYCRFFLHAIAEETEDAMMSTVMQVARPGDIFAAEFRVEEDEKRPKAHGNHFRRYLNPERFSDKLENQFGFRVIAYQVGSGLSPYRGEDPVLCRIIGLNSNPSGTGPRTFGVPD